MFRKSTGTTVAVAVLVVGAIWYGNSGPQVGAMVPEDEASVMRGGCHCEISVECKAGTYKNNTGVDCTKAQTLYNDSTCGSSWTFDDIAYCCGNATSCYIYDTVVKCGSSSGP